MSPKRTMLPTLTQVPISSYASTIDPDEGHLLKYIESATINGTKCARIEHQDVAPEIEYWN